MHIRDKANQSKLRPDIPQEMKTERKSGTHGQQFYSPRNKNEIPLFAARRMKLKGIILNEMSQTVISSKK